MRRIALASCLVLAACDASTKCDGPRLALALTFFGPEHVHSLLITYQGDGVDEREIQNITGAPNLEITAAGPPVGSKVLITVRAYESEEIRGRLLGEGHVGPTTFGACDRMQLELTDRFLLNPDAGPAKDAGGEDAQPDTADAGEREDGGPPDVDDAGVIEDGGDEPICVGGLDPATVALFAFDNAEATTGIVTDVVSGIVGVAQPAQGAVASTAGPAACGDAAAFFGAGYLEIPSEGLAPATGSVDFDVRFDGPDPTARQGIVSRDAQGQTSDGQLTVFRTCDEHLVARFQDLQSSIYRCSDTTLPIGTWVHVTIDFGDPDFTLALDGVTATSTGTRLANVDCTTALACDRPGIFDLSGNQNPWVLGADSSGSVDGAAEPTGNYFVGGIDQFRISTDRR